MLVYNNICRPLLFAIDRFRNITLTLFTYSKQTANYNNYISQSKMHIRRHHITRVYTFTIFDTFGATFCFFLSRLKQSQKCKTLFEPGSQLSDEIFHSKFELNLKKNFLYFVSLGKYESASYRVGIIKIMILL